MSETYKEVAIADITNTPPIRIHDARETGEVYIPLTMTSSAETTGEFTYQVPEKYCPHFKTEEEARAYIDRMKDPNSDPDNTGTFNTHIVVSGE